MLSSKKWNVDFAGILVTDEEVDITIGRNPVFINNQNTLQFNLKIISNPPSSFPNQVKVVTCFAEELVKWGFEDDIDMDHEERRRSLKSFLEGLVVVFRVDVKRQGTKEFYVAKILKICRKADGFKKGMTLFPVPIFTETTTEKTQSEFEKILVAQKYVGDNPHISQEDEDTPSYILWKEEEEYILYGDFIEHTHAYGGFKFIAIDEKIHKFNIPEEWIMESYINDEVLFMDADIYKDIEEKLKGAEILQSTDSGSVNQNNNSEKFVEKDNMEEKVLKEEAEFMQRFIEAAIKEGLCYEENDLYNFHTAMKSSNLVILAGMSGTGKSKLVQCYANALRLSQEQLLFIPVRPFWQDDADVIGYLDTLNNIYRPGDSGLVNTLIKANDDKDYLYIVCFDEMNLARVEHYFSQFLSVLELDEGKRELQLYNDEYANRIHNQHLYQPRVPIGRNVIFVGTVNLDESTYHFSDKVLDRANVLQLQLPPYENLLKVLEERKVNKEKEKEVEYSQRVQINFDTYDSFRNKTVDIGLTQQELQCLWSIHIELQKCNRKIGIGWRIVRQIGKYIKSLPGCSPLTRREAFDLQIAQRVMTKIRGAEEQFDTLIGIYDSENDVVESSMLLRLFNENINISDFNHSKDILKEKSKELKLYGHTI